MIPASCEGLFSSNLCSLSSICYSLSLSDTVHSYLVDHWYFQGEPSAIFRESVRFPASHGSHREPFTAGFHPLHAIEHDMDHREDCWDHILTVCSYCLVLEGTVHCWREERACAYVLHNFPLPCCKQSTYGNDHWKNRWDYLLVRTVSHFCGLTQDSRSCMVNKRFFRWMKVFIVGFDGWCIPGEDI